MPFPRLVLVPVLCLLGVVAVACGGSSSDGAAGSVTVRDAVVTEPANPSVAAVRLVIDNTGTDDDTLTGVSSPIGKAAVHRSEVVDGLSKMTAVPTLAIPAGEIVTFAPGGLHVMLQDITDPLAAGDTFELSLTFEHAGTLTTTVTVEGLGTDAYPDAHPDMEHTDHG